jgi:signal transduction histidine kinase
VIEVSDDGPGFSESARQKLFQPFAGSSRDGGTGLGLVIVRDIMRAHGGDVALVSGPDEKTTFRLVLPRQALETQS